jgi:hypothetical protein
MSTFKYCTLAEAKYQLRVPAVDVTQDEHIDRLILAASAMVKNYMGKFSVYQAALDDDDEPIERDSNYEPELESFGDSNTEKHQRVRPEVKQAVLVLVAELFRNREGDGNFDGNYLPATVRAILYPLRDPAL